MSSGDNEQTHIEGNSNTCRIKTIEAYISGNVQRVGFRACVRKLALSLSITGEVMNLDDGRVYLLATGEHAIIEKMLSSLYECPRAYIREIQTKELAVKDYQTFTVIRPA